MIFWLVVRTFISGLIILYLQVLLMPGLAIGGVIGNLFPGWIVYQAGKKPINVFVPVLFILGLCHDLTMPATLGLQTLLYMLLAVGVEEFEKPLEKDSAVTMLLTVSLANVVYMLLSMIVAGVQAGFNGRLIALSFGMLAYNLVVSGIVVLVFVFLSRLRLDFQHG